MTLDQLPVSTQGLLQRAAFVSLSPQESALLRAMGLQYGSIVKIIRQGDPCIVRVLSTKIALARAIAKQIQVYPIKD